MDIKKFKYYKLIEETMNTEKSYRSTENKTLEKKDRMSGSDKLLVIQSLNKMNRYMIALAKGNKTDRLLFKQLKLEKEYIRAKERRDLSILIEEKTGQTAGGMYKLAEIGRVLGLSRERIRQIEDSAMKSLRHPSVGRVIRNYTENIKWKKQ